MRIPQISPTIAPPSLWPLALGQSVGDLKIAGKTLLDWQRAGWGSINGASDCGQDALAWVAPEDLEKLSTADSATGAARLVDTEGRVLAWIGSAAAESTLQASSASFFLIHPWDVLRLNEILVSRIQENSIAGEISAAAQVDGILVLGAGSRILPGVFIEGTVVIGKDCKIGPNCYLRGNTSIGDKCHIGQSVEIKNCLIGDQTNVGHLSYVGDSVLGNRVNFGAGTTTSNLRHDGTTHRSMVAGTLVDTGRRKFGTIVGDGVHTGIHTAIYPGRKFGPKSTTRPGAIVEHDVI